MSDTYEEVAAANKLRTAQIREWAAQQVDPSLAVTFIDQEEPTKLVAVDEPTEPETETVEETESDEEAVTEVESVEQEESADEPEAEEPAPAAKPVKKAAAKKAGA